MNKKRIAAGIKRVKFLEKKRAKVKASFLTLTKKLSLKEQYALAKKWKCEFLLA